MIILIMISVPLISWNSNVIYLTMAKIKMKSQIISKSSWTYWSTTCYKLTRNKYKTPPLTLAKPRAHLRYSSRQVLFHSIFWVSLFILTNSGLSAISYKDCIIK